MNQGLFGFSGSNYREPISVQEFDTSGQYTVPRDANWFQILVIGGGGGGGGGRRAATSTATYGGGGGGAGAYVLDIFSRDQLRLTNQSSFRVLIGSGGAAGAGATTDDTNGSAGSTAGNTSIFIDENPDPIIFALGGLGGNGGSLTGGLGGGGRSCSFWKRITAGPTGANSSISGTSHFDFSASYTSNAPFSPAGASGGGISTGNIGNAGGNIQWSSANVTRMSAPLSTSITNVFASGSALNSSSQGENGISAFMRYGTVMHGGVYGFGYGGAGGGSGVTATAGAAGNGYRGGGGGGGGASRNGFNSGAGGRGGNGYMLVIAMR